MIWNTTNRDVLWSVSIGLRSPTPPLPLSLIYHVRVRSGLNPLKEFLCFGFDELYDLSFQLLPLAGATLTSFSFYPAINSINGHADLVHYWSCTWPLIIFACSTFRLFDKKGSIRCYSFIRLVKVLASWLTVLIRGVLSVKDSWLACLEPTDRRHKACRSAHQR